MLLGNAATTINTNRKTTQTFIARQTHYQLEEESEIRIDGTF
jgi:hypothetical protein